MTSASVYHKGVTSIYRTSCSNHSPNVCIYLSTLNVKPGGTTGVQTVNRGYCGSAISKLEYDGASLIQNKLKAKPLALLPKNLQNWLGQENIQFKIVDVPVKLSPSKVTNKDSEFENNLIILGTGVYNSFSDYYLNEYFKKHSDLYVWHFFHGKDANGERIIGVSRKGFENLPIDKGRNNHSEPAFIQRINDVDCGITVFICAGLGSSATFGSARYLSENWKNLQKTFGNKEFGIALLFDNQDPDSEFVGQPQVCYEGFLRRIPHHYS